ncbi:MAG: TonB-dependent receptor plug domain-containing protein [Ferruginibacter sp.]
MSKEKIYIQTDHVFYKPGDVVYFKLYLVKAIDQTPGVESNIAYVELISPAGTVVLKSNFKVADGYAEGSFDFADQSVGGIYKIRAYTNWMQNENDSRFFLKEITVLKMIAPRILMKLNFPEKGYGPGSEVKAVFSMRNLNNETINNYAGKFTVSIGGEVKTSRDFRTDNEGKAAIIFSLPQDLSTNDGLLNVTIDYDSYTESVSKSIPIALNKIDLQFMPEGGTLLENFTSTIAFKAINENGKAADVKGEVRDSDGNKVGVFESFHFGMGKFLFTPRPGQTYQAIITSPANIKQQYELPAATANGVMMHIATAKKILTVTITASNDIEVKLLASTKNIAYYSKNISLRKGLNDIQINEDIFPAGIAQFTLYTIYEKPLAERLVFLNADKQLKVTITPDKVKYLPREKITLSLKTVDEKGQPVPSNFSLSVIDDKLWSLADDKQDNILSWLLMSSELKGKIEEPQFYFKQDEPKSLPALDLLMLTNGYRYFDYIDYVTTEGKLKYLPDQDNVLSGQIVNSDNKPIPADLFLVNTVTGGKALKIKTGEDGTFFFSELLPKTSYYLFAKSLDKKEKVTIRVLQNGYGNNPAKVTEFKLLISKPVNFGMTIPVIPNPLKEDDKNLPVNNIVNGFKQVNALNDVVVIGYATQRKKDLTGAVSIVNNRDLFGAANFAGLLQGKVGGLIINATGDPGADTRISIRGTRTLPGNSPLVVMNGMPLENVNLDIINPADIESLTVLKDAAATALYGSRAMNGVIIIESKKFRNEKIHFRIPGKYYYASQAVNTAGTPYTVARKFYVPKYATTTTTQRTDFRETIYWNPVVQTGKDGTASVTFYNSDASTTFRAIAEGIAYNGKPGRTEATYAVQNALQVDAKIPPYLTVGDKALVPLVIKNNGDEVLELKISLVLPTQFKTGDYDKNIIVQPRNSLQLLIPLEALAAAKDTIQFAVTGASVNEVISLPVMATEKGFPIIETFSGNQSAQHNFTINKMIPGSLRSDLKLFKTLEGQLLDGIESMLREPFGCFEQTSSSTYPNIYVLKYLKESGKLNPAIEKKAMNYIEAGYNKLIGFETAENGFEWFGKTPPHEALTAYGLLEFTDMQEFIEVDKKMLERTKKFLLSRRDGNGSFTLVNRGYDQFASVPNRVANIYIVYALTRAGIGKEIRKEYETAVKRAMESKDGYQLSMMALTAYYMKDNLAYNRLMEELNEQSQKVNMNAETSVVNSRDASLRVETYALYALALMKAQVPPIGKIAGLITKILSEKSYYGYGSTQSTVLALQAIVEYSKLAGSITDDAPVIFTVNNNLASVGETVTEKLQEGKNSFAVNYPQKDKAIPYNLEVSYNTLTPPNSEKAVLKLYARLKNNKINIGETVRMDIEVINQQNILQPMAIAKIGIPAGLSVQPWQLKEILEKKQAAYYEIFDNYLVFYWMGFAAKEIKSIHLDLKADVPGSYKGKASTVYLYYTPEYKHWNEGVEVQIK